MILFFCI